MVGRAATVQPAPAANTCGRGGGGIMESVPTPLYHHRSRKSKSRRSLMSCEDTLRISAEDEADLVQMLNDSSSELYRLFSQHNPKKSPQQCFLDLKYASPEDLEAKSLYEKVLKYAQLHRKLDRKIRGGGEGKVKVEQESCGVPTRNGNGCEIRKDIKRERSGRREVPFSQFTQQDGAADKIERKKKEPVACSTRKGRIGDYPADNPLFMSSRKCDRGEDAESDILKSYKRAMTTANVDTGMRLALLDEDYNRMAAGCGDAVDSLPAFMRSQQKRHQSEPPRTGNCYATQRPMRSNRLQHSLSSVSSIEVHKTNTTCSMSSTSISISTCEIENNSVQDIMNKICSLESQKRQCRDGMESPRDLSTIRKKQRGLLMEFTKERERQRRRMAHENQNEGCDPCAIMRRNNKYSSNNCGSCGASQGGGAVNGMSPKVDMDSCVLSASLFGNAAALKEFERKSGMSIENLLKQREKDLAYRKQRAQELLKWHQRITTEEDCVKQMETQLMMSGRSEGGATMASGVTSHNNHSSHSKNNKVSKTGCTQLKCDCGGCCPPKCCNPCNCCDPCSCGGCCGGAEKGDDGGCGNGKGKEKKVNRICPENPPLCCSETQNCGCENCSKTYCIAGRTLNKIWKDISGLPCDKYNNCFEYNLTDTDFEELYATAKRERKIMRAGLEECTRCPNFDKEEVKEKREYCAFSEKDRMGDTFGCRRGECEKDEEWTMMFHQPKHVELETAAPREKVLSKEMENMKLVVEDGEMDKENKIEKLIEIEEEREGNKEEKNENEKENRKWLWEKVLKMSENGDSQEKKDDSEGVKKIKSVTTVRKLLDDFKLRQGGGIYEIQRELRNGMKEKDIVEGEVEQQGIAETQKKILIEHEIEKEDEKNEGNVENEVDHVQGITLENEAKILREVEILTETELNGSSENQKMDKLVEKEEAVNLELLEEDKENRLIDANEIKSFVESHAPLEGNNSQAIEVNLSKWEDKSPVESREYLSTISGPVSSIRPEELVEVLDLSLKRKPSIASHESGDNVALKNLPPVPLCYILKEVPSVEKVLGMLRQIKDGNNVGREMSGESDSFVTDLSNPYLRIMAQEIPYLINEANEEGIEGQIEENFKQEVLENTIIDRLEQLRIYQLNLKRAHMGIGELIFEGPHFPHVQKIQDLIEYPQTEEESANGRGEQVKCSCPAERGGNEKKLGWSPPYQESSMTYHQRVEEVEEQREDDHPIHRRYSGGIPTDFDVRRDRSCDEDDCYFDEEDEFLDYYSDMQYLKQSERQILAIFTDHIMNSMLDEVLLVVQRHYPK